MKPTNIALSVAGILLCMLAINSCGTIRNVIPNREILLQEYNGQVPTTFSNIDIPVKVRVSDNSSKSASINIQRVGQTTYTPEISTFAKSAAESFMYNMGFKLSPSANYVLEIDITSFENVHSEGCEVGFSYSLSNEAGESVIPNSSAIAFAKQNNMTVGETFGLAYYEALKKVKWERIAKILTIPRSTSTNKNAKVTGDGTTALEHLVIRWNIESRPKGADVSWRVISSTPDVANTNSNYVGTTPYESTETFDIKGLSVNNSGNVQIEVTCERPGYLPQKKRFNLRQVIDQKEISAKFNLIKDDE